MKTFNDTIDIDYCELILRQLEQERWRIVKKGRLSASDDRRLNEIDNELDYWVDVLEMLDADEEDEWYDELPDIELPTTFAF
jgi:hypothetical protein